MFINLKVHNRAELSAAEQEFLCKIVPLSRQLQCWTKGKAEFKNIPSPEGIHASIILGLILVRSNFGESYLCGVDCNYMSLEHTPRWTGKVTLYKDILYKSFKDISEFAINWSDEICFFGEHKDTLRSKDFDFQLRNLSQSPSEYAMIRNIIDYFGLRDFDYGKN